ncbi:MAG: NFACT RNA binding domain-containing protein [Zetaproteobacteria bacterium]|nr:NFACT RNA binding domain-containing protein [Zetaproteobacteria bacterium]
MALDSMVVDENSPLRIHKIWQGNSAFVVMQSSTNHAEVPHLPKKFFLVIDCHQASFGIRIETTKPPSLQVGSTGLAALMRKYLARVKIIAASCHPSSGDIVLILRGQIPQPGKNSTTFTHSGYLWLARRRPPELNLTLASGEQIFRFGQKGFFNKVKQGQDVEARFRDLSDTPLHPYPLCIHTPETSTPNEPNTAVPPVSQAEPEQAALRHKITRRIKTVTKALQQQQGLLNRQGNTDTVYQQAKLLQAFLYKVQPGDIELRLDEIESGIPGGICIPLDPEKSPTHTLENLFKQAKKGKKTAQLGSRRQVIMQDQLTQLEALRQQLDTPLTSAVALQQLQAQASQLGVKFAVPPSSAPGKSAAASSLFRTIRCQDGTEFLIGRSPSENDLLTKKANSADFWFHVTQGGGSHIILPQSQLRKHKLTAPSAAMIRQGCILALHFSSLKNECSGEVYVTQKRNLRKTKGLAPGLWLVDRSKVIFTKYDSSERDHILQA